LGQSGWSSVVEVLVGRHASSKPNSHADTDANSNAAGSCSAFKAQT